MPEADDWGNANFAEVADIFAVPFDGGFVEMSLGGLDAAPRNTETEGVNAEFFEEFEVGFVASLVVDGVAADVINRVFSFGAELFHERGVSKPGGILTGETGSVGQLPLGPLRDSSSFYLV